MCQGRRAISVTKAGLIRTVTHPICNAPHLLQELRDECIVNTGLNKQACSRDTGLARSDEGGKSRPVYCRRNVGIVENYDWGLSPSISQQDMVWNSSPAYLPAEFRSKGRQVATDDAP